VIGDLIVGNGDLWAKMIGSSRRDKTFDKGLSVADIKKPNK